MIENERKYIHHYHFSCILTVRRKWWCGTSEVYHMKKWQNPSRHMGLTFTTVLCQCESLVGCQYLSYETKDDPFPQCPQIFQWLAHGAGKLYCSQPMWVPLSRSSSKWWWQFMPHSLYVSGTHNIKYHKSIICSVMWQGWKAGEPGLHCSDSLAFTGSLVLS